MQIKKETQQHSPKKITPFKATEINASKNTSNEINADKTETWSFLVLGGTFLLMVVGLMYAYALQQDFSELRDARINSSWV